MNVLTINQIIEKSEEIGNQNPFDVFLDSSDAIAKIASNVRELTATMDADAESAKQVVLHSLSEEKFVDYVEAVQAAILTSMISQGNGKGLFRSHINGDLKGYTHTVVLTVIGTLFREGVL